MLSLVAAEAENGTAETVTGANAPEMQSGRGPAQAANPDDDPLSKWSVRGETKCLSDDARVLRVEWGVRLVLENSTACTLSMPIY